VSTNNQIAITNLVRQNGAVHPALGHADPVGNFALGADE